MSMLELNQAEINAVAGGAGINVPNGGGGGGGVNVPGTVYTVGGGGNTPINVSGPYWPSSNPVPVRF